jgi:hypothetical protein
VTLHRYVVLAQRVRAFDDIEQAKLYAEANVPAVICERTPNADGTTSLVEILRHDFLYDGERDEWRVMMG